VSGRVPKLRRAQLLLVVGLGALGALYAFVLGDAAVTESQLGEPELTALPRAPTACRFAGDEALAHARTLERAASAHWERVPFALEEAPRAYLQMSEAELCYGVADRPARLRTAAKRREYEAEIERRFARARLLLSVAQREQQLERARKQIAALRALLERAPEEVRALRAELEQLDRTYAAQLVERAQESKR